MASFFVIPLCQLRMVSQVRRILTVFTVCLALAGGQTAFAQEPEENRLSTGPRKQLATIIFAGLGGAVLGLSTLSFYGRPQDRLANIGIGFAVGIIVGTVYVTYKSAKTPQEFYGGGLTDEPASPKWSRADFLAEPDSTPQLGLSWNF